ncbi:hypothetical protein Q8F55_001482 [Vanrija albida]|uniref:Uncharacterized protein n=1 Tax=Vanrija albida TaxID=181172 RepID=A0ABR3QG63_9TREE
MGKQVIFCHELKSHHAGHLTSRLLRAALIRAGRSNFDPVYKSYRETMVWLHESIQSSPYKAHFPDLTWAEIRNATPRQIDAMWADNDAWYRVESCTTIMLNEGNIHDTGLDIHIQRLGEALGQPADDIVDEVDKIFDFYYHREF